MMANARELEGDAQMRSSVSESSPVATSSRSLVSCATGARSWTSVCSIARSARLLSENLLVADGLARST
jgi:hypothetical protein